MKRLMSIALSVLLLTQSIFVYAGGGKSSNDQTNYSFFNIPRLSRETVEKDCEQELMFLESCQETFKNITVLSENNIGHYSLCSAIFGKDFKNNPRSTCYMYKEYGVDREKAWETYRAAYAEEQGEYWALSPEEMYDKYQQVTKDIVLLWDINPEYIEDKMDKIAQNLAMVLALTLGAYEAGVVIGALFDAEGLFFAGNIARLTFSGKRTIIPAFQFAIQRADVRFLVDLAFTGAYIYMDTIYVKSAFKVMSDLPEELQQVSLQKHADIEYAVKMRDLLLGIVKPKLSKETQRELATNKKEFYNSRRELREAVEAALKEGGWATDEKGSRRHKEAVISLYALEYIRAELADKSDTYRYRQAAMDLAQIYLPNENGKYELTNLVKERYLLAKDAYEVKQKLKEYIHKDQVDAITRVGFVP